MSRYAFYKCLTFSLIAHMFLAAAVLEVSRTAAALPSRGKVDTEIVYMIQLVDLPASTPPKNHATAPVQSPAPMPPKTSNVLVQREKVPLTTPVSEKSLSSELSLASLEENHPPEAVPTGLPGEPHTQSTLQPARAAEEPTRLHPLEDSLKKQKVKAQGPGGKEGYARDDLAHFFQEVRNRLEEAKRYPWKARIKGHEGIVRIQFSIKTLGEPEDIRLLESSGWETLDQEALAIVQRVGQFPSPPSEWDQGIPVRVPVVFKLDTP